MFAKVAENSAVNVMPVFNSRHEAHSRVDGQQGVNLPPEGCTAFDVVIFGAVRIVRIPGAIGHHS